MSLYTIGYEGVNVAQMIDVLQDHAINRLVDVREHAFSMKRGFSKTPLKASLENEGILYEHWRHLGAPKPVRNALKSTGDWQAYCESYYEYLQTQAKALEDLATLAVHERVVLLCFEANPFECHRSLIAKQLHETRLVKEVRDLRTETLVAGFLDTQIRQRQAVSF